LPIVLKSGSLKLLEPSGPVQACNGTALPLQCSKDRQRKCKENLDNEKLNAATSTEKAAAQFGKDETAK
jgi:hypothetical protein